MNRVKGEANCSSVHSEWRESANGPSRNGNCVKDFCVSVEPFQRLSA